jgi:hypothetical protein
MTFNRGHDDVLVRPSSLLFGSLAGLSLFVASLNAKSTERPFSSPAADGTIPHVWTAKTSRSGLLFARSENVVSSQKAVRQNLELSDFKRPFK